MGRGAQGLRVICMYDTCACLYKKNTCAHVTHVLDSYKNIPKVHEGSMSIHHMMAINDNIMFVVRLKWGMHNFHI